MTKFITYYNLCRIHNPKEFLGISADMHDGNIITTLDKNIIIVVKINTQKQICSWSVVEKLSTKVIYDRLSQKYVGVFAQNIIRLWDDTTNDVNKCKKLKFNRNIADLITTNDDTLVLYADGSCQTLKDALATRKDEEKGSLQLDLTLRYTFTDAKAWTLTNGNQIITYFMLRHNNNDDIQLIRLSLIDGKSLSYSLKRKNLDVHVVGYAVIEGDKGPQLMTIWSDKRIFQLNLNDSTAPERSPGNFVFMLPTLNVDSPLTILGISKQFVAIYGANCGQDGASLLFYSTQFKVIKAKQCFKSYFNFARLWVIDQNLLLATGQDLSLITYRITKELLCDLIGTQISNNFTTNIEDDYINEEEDLEESLQYAKETHTIRVNNAQIMNEENAEIVLADGNKIPFQSLHHFDNTLSALSKLHMHIDVLEVESATESVALELMSNYNDDGFVTSEVKVVASQLERCGASEHEITEKLLTVLIKADLIQDIANCLRRYTNISDKMLAKTLRYVLDKYMQENPKIKVKPEVLTEHMDVVIDEKKSMKQKSEDNVDVDFPNLDLLADKYRNVETATKIFKLVDVLNLILSCTFDNKTIIEHIRREIDYPHILFLLEHLYNLLNDNNQQFEEHPSVMMNFIDFEMQIFNWFGVCLDTHFQKLALSRDIELVEILSKWHELFESYKQQASKLENISALFYNLIEGNQILTNNNDISQWYTIEEIDLF